MNSNFPIGCEQTDYDTVSPSEQNENCEQDGQLGHIIQTGSITQAGSKYTIHCLTIIGQIEGHYILPPQNKTSKYEHIIPQLVAVEQDPKIDGLIIILNTVGGDVEAGLAIAELISGMKTPTVSLVLGGGHSIGVPLAVSSKYSFIVPSATMTIHPVRINGLVLGIPQTFSYFEKIQSRITQFVCNNSKMKEERFCSLMLNNSELMNDIGTILSGQQAVQEGLIDSIGGLSDAIDCLFKMIEENSEQDTEQTENQD